MVEPKQSMQILMTLMNIARRGDRPLTAIYNAYVAEEIAEEECGELLSSAGIETVLAVFRDSEPGASDGELVQDALNNMKGET
jgi:hypothetical protein